MFLLGEDKIEFSISGAGLYNFLTKRNVSVVKLSSKPFLTEANKIKRLFFARNMLDALERGEGFHLVHFDEKWFYTDSGRKFAKVLSEQKEEEAGAAAYDQRVEFLQSRRFAEKRMIITFICSPIMYESESK